MNSTELRQHRAALHAKAKQLHTAAEAEQRELTEAEDTEFTSLMADVDRLEKDIIKAERSEKLVEVEAELRHTTGRKTGPAIHVKKTHDASPAELLQAWTLYGSRHYKGGADTLYAASERGLDLNADAITLASLRALGTGTASAGGYTVPTGFTPMLVEKLKYFCNFRQFATVETSPNGEDLHWPTVDNTGNVAEGYGEVAQVDEDGADDPAFGEVVLKRFRRSTRVLKVSTDLLANTGIGDFEGRLSSMLGEQMGRKQSADIGGTNAGSTAPEGFFYGLTVGANLATGNPLTWQKFMDVEAALDPAYLDQPGIGYVMHSKTYAAIRKFADSNNVPLYVQSLSQNGPGRTLNGYPVYFCNSMTEIGTPGDNQVLAVFGKLDDYVIRDIPSQTSIIRYNELFRRTGQVGLQVEAWYDARWVTKAGVVTLNSFDAP